MYDREEFCEMISSNISTHGRVTEMYVLVRKGIVWAWLHSIKDIKGIFTVLIQLVVRPWINSLRRVKHLTIQRPLSYKTCKKFKVLKYQGFRI
jgi:hypothetical protein